MSSNIRAIVLDFDGVLVESNAEKTEAFKELFNDFPDHLDRILEYTLAHNSTVRYEKFKYVYQNILGLEYTNEIKQELSRRYSELVFNQIVNCPYVPGALDFLNELFERKPMFLISMTPEEESIQLENSTIPQEPVNGPSVTKAVAIEKLETLEKEKADLLAELDELRKGAEKKISVLEEEVAALREEAEQLRKLTEN